MTPHNPLPGPSICTRRIHRIVNSYLSLLLVEEIEQVLFTGFEDLDSKGLSFFGCIGPKVVVRETLLA